MSAIRPDPIDVEATFIEFVGTFRQGGLLKDFVSSLPIGANNADYYFPDDNVIVELKTLEKNPLDDSASLERRIMSAYKSLGYEFHDFLAWLFRRNNFPDDVNRRVFSKTSDYIIKAVKKAKKQIDDSRLILRKPDACGLILVANSGNDTIELMQLGYLLLNTFEKIESSDRDALVIFHRMFTMT
jgi:hypothetical protein